MKGRSSSKQGMISKVCKSMEKRKADKVKEEPHLSGAYIRSLVKHLSSTRTKDSLNGDEKMLGNLNTNGQCFSDPNNMQQESSPPLLPSPPIKKQVRRRQHTSKPYQERLLNMAEARKEIVTALKFHRASMKQQEAATNHDQSLGNSGSKISLKAYPSTTATTTTTTTKLSNNYLDHHPSLSCPPSLPYYWPISTISPPPLPPPYHEDLNIILPNAPLGLNLNIQDFHNLETNIYHNPLSNYSTSSSLSLTSSCSSSSSCTSSSAVISEMAASLSEEVVTPSTTTSSGGANTNEGSLHHAMDDEEMEEIRSLGEQHQMEWNDTVNLVMSARWLEFLKTIEIGPEAGNDSHKYDYDEFSPFDQIMEFPPWNFGLEAGSMFEATSRLSNAVSIDTTPLSNPLIS